MAKPRSEMTPEKLALAREADRRYREKNASAIAARKAIWGKTPEGAASKRRAQRRWRDAHPDEYRELQYRCASAWRAKVKARDPEAFAAKKAVYTARYVEKHKDRILQAQRNSYRARTATPTARAEKGLALATAAIPKHLPRQVRDEVLGDVMLALIDGTLKLEDVGRKVPEYIKAHNREYDDYKKVSLDAAHPVTGQAWVENLDSDTPHF